MKGDANCWIEKLAAVLFPIFCLLGAVYSCQRVNAAIPPAERVIITEGDANQVIPLLREGWTIKHVSAALGVMDAIGFPTRKMIVFVLTPPSEEVAAEVAAAKKAEFEKRRAEFLAKQPKVEKP